MSVKPSLSDIFQWNQIYRDANSRLETHQEYLEVIASKFKVAIAHHRYGSSSRMAIAEAAVQSAASMALLQNPNSTTVMIVHSNSLSTFYLFKRVILPVIAVIPGFLYSTMTFATITLPSWLFTLFSTSLTFTLNFTTILFMLAAFSSTIIWIVRYRYLNMYSRLPPQPARKEPQIDIFPDAPEGDSKQGFSNYLDEFMSAIKVFGYLERPVFHELTRTMQTRKLIAGETLLLEEEDGFCLVVDGLVQIFVKSYREGAESGNANSRQGTLSDDEDDLDAQGGQGYQLLTEVRNGASMSSLFSILSLFTEDVKLRHDDEHERLRSSVNLENAHSNGTIDGTHAHARASSVTDTPSPIHSPVSPRRVSIGAGRISTLPIASANRPLSAIPPLSLDLNAEARKEGGRHDDPLQAGRKAESAHPDILARATVDTTIAIIPATAFRRLTRVYPKATAHIVQVILTRLQRVTLDTGHAYLGLTSEVLRTEKLMNKYTTYDLPGFLRGSALDRLKEKFLKERERSSNEDDSQGIALHNPSAGQRRRPSSIQKERVSANNLSIPEKSVTQRRSGYFQQSPTPDQSGVSAGDLLTNLQILRAGGRFSQLSYSQPLEPAEDTIREAQSPLDYGTRNPFRPAVQGRPRVQHQESRDEDMLFRESIMSCMFKAIGLTDLKHMFPKTDSSEQSPMLVSYDSRRQRAVFNNLFGLVDPYEGVTDGTDTDSLNSASASLLDSGSSPPIAEELIGDVEIVFFPKGSVLVEQGERNPGLYYVIDGFLDVSVQFDEHDHGPSVMHKAESIDSDPHFSSQFQKSNSSDFQDKPNSNKEKTKRKRNRSSLFLIKPGGLAGYLGTVSSYRSFVDVTAKTDVYVGFLPRRSIERIVEKYPVVLLTMAKRLTTLLPRLILHIDFALEWMQINAGQAIYHQGEDSDAIYIVLNGRLRATQESEDGKIKSLGEYGQGDSVGELEVLTESSRTSSLHAIRDTELARFPKTLFNSLAFEHPGITIKISKIIASRMRALIDNPLSDTVKDPSLAFRNVNSTVNLRTVAILPVAAGVPVVEFSRRLLSALSQLGTSHGATSLNQSAILNHLGRHAFSRMGRLKLSQYLADLEEKYGLVLYVADTPVKSPWTRTCISQADCILLVGLAEGSPEVGEYERYLLTTKTTVRKELVLLHAERFCPRGLTRQWLRNRMWINGSHHHIQMAFRDSPEPVLSQQRRLRAALKERVQTLSAGIQKYTSLKIQETPLYTSETPLKGDFHRLARRICGKSVGLVLGGGGARGIAHVGVIRALEEAGIPIDIVGGTSIGAFIGALYAWDADMVPMYGRAKKFASRMGSMWRFALDLTYPALAYTTGHEFNRGLFKTFGNSQIEDFWLEFYCNTTNISKSRADYHSGGYVWRYVRASMTLAGLIPPLCDEGNLLLDGGYIDNLTVSHMKALGADVIFAVDVGSIDENTPQQYDDSLSGFWVVFNRLNPFSSGPPPPTINEVQARLAYVSSVDALERAKTIPSCKYMIPPVQPYGTLEFGNFDKICEVGYQYGKEYLARLREEGAVLPIMEETEKKNLRRTMAPRRASI